MERKAMVVMRGMRRALVLVLSALVDEGKRLLEGRAFRIDHMGPNSAPREIAGGVELRAGWTDERSFRTELCR